MVVICAKLEAELVALDEAEPKSSLPASASDPAVSTT